MAVATSTALLVAAAATAASAYMSYDSGQKARAQQGEAMQQARSAADKQATMQEQQINKANAKSPDSAALLAGNTQAAKGGAGGTMLTGPQGVNPNDLTLGKSTLLGQ